MNEKVKHTLHCSFCGKDQHEVKKLIAGPTVFICDECVWLCVDILKADHPPISALTLTEVNAAISHNEGQPDLAENQDRRQHLKLLKKRKDELLSSAS